MFKYEKRFLEIICEKSFILFFIGISMIGLLVRICGRQLVSGDAAVFLLPWFETAKEQGGLSALSGQIGDYNITYQFLICLLSYLPFEPLYLIKGLSIVFDYALAIVCAGFARDIAGGNAKKIWALTYGIILMLPTSIINSALWGQCDSIYTTFLVMSLWLLWKERYKSSFFILGIAFAFKLQTVFLLPFFVIYYILEKKFSILNFGLFFAAWYIMCIPGFLYGRTLLEPIKIYMSQTRTYEDMFLGFPSFWAITGGSYEYLGKLAIFFTIGVLGIGLMYMMSKSIRLKTPGDILLTASWSVWTCLFFLPCMHERYAYFLDILLILLTVLKRKYLLFAAIGIFCSIVTCANNLFGAGADYRKLAELYFAAYIGFSYLCTRDKQ